MAAVGNATHSYGRDTATSVAIEIRLVGRGTGRRWRLVAYANPNGTVGYDLTDGRGGISYSLSALQATGTFPGKAIVGWQAEFIAAAATGLYAIEEVR